MQGCKDFLEEHPYDQLSEATFWNDQNDALRGLMGVYQRLSSGHVTWDGWDVNTIYADYFTDIGTHIRDNEPNAYPVAGILSTNAQVASLWKVSYQKIARANYFLDNINKCDMNEDLRNEMIGEAKLIRAYCYFWLSQLFGNVPLVTTTLTFDEANSISQSSQQEVVEFLITDLTDAAKYLPVERPSSQKGRYEKGAALAIKGRLLMSQKRWSEASDTYKTIMDLNRYIIDPRFERLFVEEAENSKEIIFATHYTAGYSQPIGQRINQLVNWTSYFGGNNGFQFFQEFVDKFLMIDGLSIEESPLFDSENPFKNRDPRLYYTVLLPGYSKFNNKTFQGHPDTIAKFGQFGNGCTGYAINKFYDRKFTGTKTQSGADYYLIRYAEILLSRLESELEAGKSINQELLDKTINLVRKRDEVDMPSVTETNPSKLREIIKRERLIEFAGEGGIRYWDLLRRRELHEVLSQVFHGMQITKSPNNYTGTYKIDEKGHLIMGKKLFYEHNYLWPIPLNELDVNTKLVQNPDYQ